MKPKPVQLKVTCASGIPFGAFTIPFGAILGGAEMLHDAATKSFYWIAYFDGQPVGVSPCQVQEV